MKELVWNIILCHIADRFTPSPLGRPNCAPEIVLEYVLLVLQSGMAWRHLQQTRCPYDYRTVYSFFRRWSRQRIFASAIGPRNESAAGENTAAHQRSVRHGHRVLFGDAWTKRRPNDAEHLKNGTFQTPASSTHNLGQQNQRL